jgi:hypothetical protein
MPLSRGQLICNAHKRDGARCGQVAIKGKTKCRMHGGRSLSGRASPRFVTGKYSKVLPARLVATYHEAKQSPRLLSLADDIAAADARLVDLFQRVDSGESGALWQTLGSTLDAFNAALAANELPAMHRHLATLRQLITQGTDDYQAWDEIQKLWDTRCKLTQTETKTLITMQQMVTTEQLMVFMGVVTDTIQRAVTQHADHAAAQAILNVISIEFERIGSLEAAKAS